MSPFTVPPFAVQSSGVISAGVGGSLSVGVGVGAGCDGTGCGSGVVEEPPLHAARIRARAKVRTSGGYYARAMAGRIAVVDEHNRFVRWEARTTIHEQRLVHRSIHVLLFDTAGRLLIQRRHHTKQTYPRFWDVSCAGHVEESDYSGGPDDDLDAVYAAVAAREVAEELGVTPVLERAGTFGPVAGVHYEQIHLFRGISDGPFTLQADEVEEHRFVAPAELDEWLAGPEPVTDALRWWLQMIRDGALR